MPFTEDDKKKLEHEIVNVMVSALENGAIDENDPPGIAHFVLEKVDAISQYEDLKTFLTELSSKWPIFSNLASIELAELRKMVEKEVTHGVLTLLEHGKVDDALALVKTMSQESPKE